MLETLNNLFRKYIYKILGLFIGFFLLFLLIIFPLEGFLKSYISQSYIKAIIYLFIFFAWFIIWYVNKEYLPKNKNNKIGIVIAIKTESDTQKTRVKNDLIKGMKDIILRNDLTDLFYFINLEDYHSLKVNDIIDNYYLALNESIKNHTNIQNTTEHHKLAKLIKNTRGHYFIWGNIKERKEVENKYIINLNALVRHSPVNLKIHNEISSEFRSIFPKEISFFEKLEFIGFQLTSDLIFISARYMIGVAAMITGDPFISYQIHKGLIHDINKFNPVPPNLLYIQNKLKILLSEELLQQAKYHFTIKKDYTTSSKLLLEAESFDNNNYSILIFRSIYSFEIDKNPQKAIEYCDQAQNYSTNDGTWLYNKAFLQMYINNYEGAYSSYKIIKDSQFKDESYIVNQCIEFNENFIKLNPDFYESLFILGFLYFFKLKNYPLSLERFELFLKETDSNPKYNNIIREKAIFYINKIKTEMGLS